MPRLSNAGGNEGGTSEKRGVLGAKHNIKVVCPEVIAHPAEDDDPKVALDPIPAPRQKALALTNMKMIARALPFEDGTMLVGFPRPDQGVSNTWQEDEERYQKIAELAALQMLIESPADENGEAYNPHGTVPKETRRHFQSSGQWSEVPTIQMHIRLIRPTETALTRC